MQALGTLARGYKTFFMLNSTEHKFIMLMNVKMPTIVGILTFFRMINATSQSLKARKVLIFQHLSFCEQLKYHTQLSIKSFITSGPDQTVPWPILFAIKATLKE